jgi:hypothetical protein
MTCKCIYATSANTRSVRLGHEMGGYLKVECQRCIDAREAESPCAPVAESVDALVSNTSPAGGAGSIPARGTT